MKVEVLPSKEDASVNFILRYDDGRIYEARYVRRQPDYFICYLSSQDGCNRGCKFCHLTATGQTSMNDAGILEFSLQALEVFAHYKKQESAKIVHFNWMSRGEALCNSLILDNYGELHKELFSFAQANNLLAKFNISTIMPKTLKKSPAEIFNGYYPTIYYSLYSMRQGFRDKWLPGAMPAEQALDLLAEYQQVSKKIIKLHYALIEGENDSYDDLDLIARACGKRGLIVELNLVRFNPDETSLYQESKLYDEYQHFWTAMTSRYSCLQTPKIVSRVGKDCYAACGLFV